MRSWTRTRRHAGSGAMIRFQSGGHAVIWCVESKIHIRSYGEVTGEIFLSVSWVYPTVEGRGGCLLAGEAAF